MQVVKHPLILLTSWAFLVALAVFLLAPATYFNNVIEQEEFYLSYGPAQELYETIVDSSTYEAISKFLSPAGGKSTPKNIEDFGSSLFEYLKVRFDIFVMFVCISCGRACLAAVCLSVVGFLLAIPAAFCGLMAKLYKAVVFEPPSLASHKFTKTAIGLLLFLLLVAITAPIEISPLFLGLIPVACYLLLGRFIANGT